MTSSPRYRITLVHGTWAKKAPWTKKNSSFCSKLTKCLTSDEEGEAPPAIAYDRPPDWSGRNRQLDRRAGGRALARYLTTDGEEEKALGHFLVCHSHGGNVALYAAGEKDLTGTVSGIICMNTPFVCVVPRNFMPLYFAGGFIALLIASAIINQLINLVYFTNWPWWKIALAALALWPVSFLMGLLLIAGIAGLPTAVGKMGKKRDKAIEDLQLPSTSIPIMSVWTAGDEVSSGFSVASGLAGLPFAFLYLPALLLLSIGLILMLFLGVLPKVDLFQVESTGWYSSLFAWTDTHIYDTFLTAGLYITGLILALMAVALLVNTVLCVFPFGLGLRRVLLPLWMRMFATPLPVHATDSEFRSIDPTAAFLSHSAYESDEMIEAISNWIRGRSRRVQKLRRDVTRAGFDS